jgi:hypothetical protein
MTMIAVAGVCLTAQDRTAAETDAAVMGFVRYASGEPIADVRVRIGIPGDRSPPTTRTGADGSYRFDAMPAGEYEVAASHAGAVAKRIRITPGSELRDLDFSIPDGGRLRVVTGRVVMNEASGERPLPARIGPGVIMRADGTIVLPLRPGDHRVLVRLPPDYFLDAVTDGPAVRYSMEIDGRRLSSAAFSITVRPEPQLLPELVITLGVFGRK